MEEATHVSSWPLRMDPPGTSQRGAAASISGLDLASSLPFSLNWVIHSVTRRRSAGLRGAMGEHLARGGHGGSAGVLFNEVEDQDAQR